MKKINYNSRRIPLLVFILMIPLFGFSQSCISLPSSGNYIGKTLNDSTYSVITNISLQKMDSLTLTLSDISAGMLESIGGEAISIAITFDCDGQIITTKKTTQWGNLIIDSGSFSSTTGLLSINWRIPENLIEEKTEITIQ